MRSSTVKTKVLKIKKIALFALLIFVFCLGENSSLSAQKAHGSIKDAQTSEALLFANIVLVRVSDSSQVTGTSSDGNGKFLFQKISKGSYFIQASTLGYHLGNSMMFEIKTTSDEIDLGSIMLSPTSVQLNEVEIRAKKPLMEMAPGKIIMNVAEHLASQTAENAFEMLKKFPGVSIDKDDNISLNGKGGIMVMVDGRNTYMSGADLANYLKSVPASTISSIESIANPSSKYDAEGVSGILDIKTTKVREKGFNGTISAGAGGWKGYGTNESLDLNFRSKKVSVYANASYSYNKSFSKFEEATTYADGSKMSFNEREDEAWVNSSISNGMGARAGIDFYPTERDILGLSYKGSGWWQSSLANVYTRWRDKEDTVKSSMLQTADSRWASQNHNVSLNYEHTFDTVYNRKINVDFTWLRNIQGGGGSNHLDSYIGDFESLVNKSGYYLDQPLVSDIYALKLDYEHPFNQQTKLEAGIKGSYVNNNNNMEYLVDGIRDTTRSNQYLYNEWIGAAYIMVNHSFPTKTTLQVGLRAEFTAFDGFNVELDSVNKGMYARPFPNINITQQIGTDHSLNLSYRYRLSRPNYRNLNPFLMRNDATSWRGGNPFLKPEYSHNLDLTYSYKYNLFITAGYTHADNEINNMTYYNNIDGTYIATSIPQNAGFSDLLSLSVNGQFTFFERWRLRFYVSGNYGRNVFYYGLTDGEKQKQISNSFYSSVWFSTDVDIISTLTAELSAWAQLPSKGLLETYMGYLSLNLSVKKTFFDKKLTLTLSANDLLNMGMKSDSKYPDGTSSKGSYAWSGRSVWLSVSYRFGNNNMMNRSPRQSEDLEEGGRLSDGGGKGGR